MLNFAEAIEKTIRIKSVSQDGNEEISTYFSEIMKSMGFKTNLQEVTHALEGVSKRQFNLIGILGDTLVDSKTQKGLLLNTHTDTVSPGIKTNWTETNGDPFAVTIKNDQIFGLGTADVKLDFLCKLKACERYLDRRLKMPLYLVGTAAEEIGMLGAKFLVKSKFLNPKIVLVGEPSELSIVSAHKAYCIYQVGIYFNQKEKDAKGYNTRIEMRTQGRSAHGSYPHLGDNAIYKLLSALKKIKNANFQIKLSKIFGGDSINKVPDSANVEFFLPSSSFEDFKRFYKESIAHDKELNSDYGQVQVQFGGLGESGIRFMPSEIVDGIESVQKCVEKICAQEDIKDDSFNPNTSTNNLGKISKFDDHVDLFFDMRVLPSQNLDELDKKLKQEIQALHAKFPGLILKINRTRFNPPLNMSDDSELVKAALEAQKTVGIPEKITKKATSTEAAIYFSAGHHAIVFGPGKSMGNSHSPNEHNSIEHLDKAVHFYDRMIERFCL